MSKLTLHIELSESQVSALLANPSNLTNLLAYIKALEVGEPSPPSEVKTEGSNIFSTLAQLGNSLASVGQGVEPKSILDAVSKIASNISSEKKETDVEAVRQLLSSLFNKK